MALLRGEGNSWELLSLHTALAMMDTEVATMIEMGLKEVIMDEEPPPCQVEVRIGN